jgi:hypothetical protein
VHDAQGENDAARPAKTRHSATDGLTGPTDPLSFKTSRPASTTPLGAAGEILP